MEKNRAILFLVVGLIVGIIVGVAVGYAAFNNNSDNEETETTYWYYIDYGDYATSSTENGWISAESDTVLNGLFEALHDNGIDYAISDTGWITSINGIAPVWDANHSDSWASWVWTANSDNTSLEGWASTTGLDVTLGTTFYLAATTFDPDTYQVIMNPNDESGWQDGGPFA
jgi:hypothetical protein